MNEVSEVNVKGHIDSADEEGCKRIIAHAEARLQELARRAAKLRTSVDPTATGGLYNFPLTMGKPWRTLADPSTLDPSDSRS